MNLFERELADLQNLVTTGESASERILEFARNSLEDMKRMMRILPITYEFYALAFRNKKVRQTLRKYLRNYMRILPPIIQQGIQDREFRSVDPKETAIALGAVIEGTTLLWIFDRETIDLEKDVETGVDYILEGIKRK